MDQNEKKKGIFSNVNHLFAFLATDKSVWCQKRILCLPFKRKLLRHDCWRGQGRKDEKMRGRMDQENGTRKQPNNQITEKKGNHC